MPRMNSSSGFDPRFRYRLHVVACLVTFASLGSLLPCAPAFAQVPGENLQDYYPPIEPFQTGYLKVSDIHEIYYELCGNPRGIPVMVLHGGPGGGCGPNMRRFHDPKRYFIILHDQRGAGKSKPHAELRDNNTQALVDDIERLRIALRLPKVQLFGGSWGSTLALAYAEKYPRHVSSLVLRGIFTATREEIDHFYHGGVAQYYPEVFDQLKSIVPKPEEKNYPAQFLELLQSKDKSTRDKIARAWAAYETKLAALVTSDAEVQEILDAEDVYAFSLIENHYMANNCFLKEGQLLADAPKLSGIPTVICHGRYDVICPPIAAWRVMKAIPGARLVLVEAAGHSGSAPPMRSALIEGIKSIQPLIADTADQRIEIRAASQPATTQPSGDQRDE